MADKETNMNEGLPEHRGLDAAGRAAALQRLEPRGAVQVGNFADVQRYGADTEVSSDDSLALNPNQSEEDLITPAENDARQGLVTVETDRVGITDDILSEREDIEKNLQPTAIRSPENKGSEPKDVVDPSVDQPKAKK